MSKRAVRKRRERDEAAAEVAPPPERDRESAGDESGEAGGETEQPSAGKARSSRQRIALAGGLACFALVVGSVAILGSGGEEASGAGLAECVEKWNRSPDSRGTGSHVAGLHGYSEAWVLHLGPELERDPEAGGDCAVVFPAAEPDAEPEFAASVLANGRWRPLSQRSGVEVEQIGELQREGLSRANARLRPDGTLFAAF